MSKIISQTHKDWFDDLYKFVENNQPFSNEKLSEFIAEKDIDRKEYEFYQESFIEYGTRVIMANLHSKFDESLKYCQEKQYEQNNLFEAVIKQYHGFGVADKKINQDRIKE